MFRPALALCVITALGFAATAAQAQDGDEAEAAEAPQADYARTGPYVGLSGATGFLTEADDEFKSLLGASPDFEPSLGLQARVGYRIYERFSAEILFEWQSEYSGSVLGGNVDVESWAVLPVAKLYALTGRFQPFVSGGLGYLQAEASAPGASRDDWDFAGRLGGGIDVYVTENVALNFDAGYVIPVADDLDGLDYVSVGWGFLYRF